MFDLSNFLEQIKTPLIMVGIVVLIAIVVFLYLLLAGADESRRKDGYNKEIENEEKE